MLPHSLSSSKTNLIIITMKDTAATSLAVATLATVPPSFQHPFAVDIRRYLESTGQSLVYCARKDRTWAHSDYVVFVALILFFSGILFPCFGRTSSITLLCSLPFHCSPLYRHFRARANAPSWLQDSSSQFHSQSS